MASAQSYPAAIQDIILFDYKKQDSDLNQWWDLADGISKDEWEKSKEKYMKAFRMNGVDIEGELKWNDDKSFNITYFKRIPFVENKNLYVQQQCVVEYCFE